MCLVLTVRTEYMHFGNLRPCSNLHALLFYVQHFSYNIRASELHGRLSNGFFLYIRTNVNITTIVGSVLFLIFRKPIPATTGPERIVISIRGVDIQRIASIAAVVDAGRSGAILSWGFRDYCCRGPVVVEKDALKTKSYKVTMVFFFPFHLPSRPFYMCMLNKVTWERWCCIHIHTHARARARVYMYILTYVCRRVKYGRKY